MCNSQCVPGRHVKGKKKGQYADSSHGRKIARAELTKRDGPPPFLGALCRHLCENDSTAPNGFVCTLHTVWGTMSENVMDRPEEIRKKGPTAGGKIGGKTGGKTTAAIERTCEHCGKKMKGAIYFRHHGENCKMNPINLSPHPTVADL